jgi:hypothetical protein
MAETDMTETVGVAGPRANEASQPRLRAAGGLGHIRDQSSTCFLASSLAMP